MRPWYPWFLFPALGLLALTIEQGGFEAFRAGRFSDSGANLYVSRAGRIQVVNRWDLNNDGFNDVLISNDHDMLETVDAFIYWNGEAGFRNLLPELWRERPLAQTLFGLLDRRGEGVTRLPAFGGGRSLIADLNRDGYPELVFCNYIHNYPGIRSAYLYWGAKDGFRTDRRVELPTNWASGVAAADLNQDGWPDLVFANQGAEAGLSNLSREVGLESFLYWGSQRGFDPGQPTRLPTRGARDVAIADLNGDGAPDIAFLNGAREAKDLQVFWGGAGAYTAGRSQTIPLPDPTALRAADLDRDGKADLVIAAAGGRQSLGLERNTDDSEPAVLILPGAAPLLEPGRMKRLPADQPRDVALADLDGDRYPDIAVAHAGGTASAVWWGGPSGFTAERSAKLPTLSANGVTAADFNGDGRLDLAFANSHNGETHDVPSYIYWGSQRGFAPYLRTELQSFGAASVASGDLNGDARPEVVFINQYSGRYSGKLHSSIFWGNPHHHYSTASMTQLPTRGAYDSTAADFNDDGWPDIVFSNSYIQSAYLYWGGREGFSPDRRQILDVGASYASNAADFNRDGYLDLAFSGIAEGKPRGTILWGSARGFEIARATRLALQARRSALTQVAADFNRDGFLDLSFSDHYFGSLEIYWGGPEGFSESRRWVRQMHGGGLSVADLNGDGILDFVIPGMFNAASRSYNNRTRVYLGTPDGTPSPSAVADLEAFGSIECAISDLNLDGKADLACSNYMSDATRSLPLFIYWGLGEGRFSNANRTALPAESSAGVQTLDLNADGYPELIVHNHLKDGDHSIRSAIYWNGPRGFDPASRTELPTFGPHFSQMAPVGSVSGRKLEEWFIAAPIRLPGSGRRVRLKWSAREPEASRLEMEVRSADSREALEKEGWEPAAQPRPAREWVQYRARFLSRDAACWPVLDRVELSRE